MSVTINEAIELMEKWYPARKEVVYLLLGEPGIGKTEIVHQFAERHGLNVVTLLASQSVPNEIAGTTAPKIWAPEELDTAYFKPAFVKGLKENDILFMDEILTAPPQNLSACLTMIQNRLLQLEEHLPDGVGIVACANPIPSAQVASPLKNRFLKVDVRCSAEDSAKYLAEKYGGNWMLIRKMIQEQPDWKGWNQMTPRTVEKLIYQFICVHPEPEDLDELDLKILDEVGGHFLTSNFLEYWIDRKTQLEDAEYYAKLKEVKESSLEDYRGAIKDAVSKASHEHPEKLAEIDGWAKDISDISDEEYGLLKCDALGRLISEDPEKATKIACAMDDYRSGLISWSELNPEMMGACDDVCYAHNSECIDKEVEKFFGESDLDTIIGTLMKLPIWDNIEAVLQGYNLI